MNPDSVSVNDGDTVVWKPVGGTINSFDFTDDSIFSSSPHNSSGVNWQATISSSAPGEIDTYTVNVTNDAGNTFTIDPNLTIHQGG